MIYTINKIDVKNEIALLDVIPKDDPILDFKPGQFVMLALFDEDGDIWQQRPFSICSSPTNKEYIQLAIKKHGDFTQKIAGLKIGDSVGISIPSGFFIFNETKMQEVIFLAGGIGITPFMSAIRYVSEKKLPNKITLIYSNKTKKDIAFEQELRSISQKNKNIKIIFTLTDDISNSPQYEKGRINEIMIKKYCSPFKEKYFSLCGPSKFMESLISSLEKNGVQKNHIDMERF